MKGWGEASGEKVESQLQVTGSDAGAADADQTVFIKPDSSQMVTNTLRRHMKRRNNEHCISIFGGCTKREAPIGEEESSRQTSMEPTPDRLILTTPRQD